MRRKLFLIITFVICCFSLNAFASTNYQVRTEDNLGVPDYVAVTEERKSHILSTPLVDSSEKIYDFGELFSDDEEKILYDKVAEYIEEYDMDMVIVTITENPKSTAQAYGQDFYDYNTFGTNSTHDGVLLLIDMQNRRVEMITTGDAIKMYNDNRIKWILDDVFEYVPKGQYFEAAKAFVDSTSAYASRGYPTASGGEPKLKGMDKLRVLPWSGILIFAVISTAIVIGVLIYNCKMVRKAVSSRQYLVKDSVKINLIKETFLGTSVHKSARVQSSSGGGGSSTSSGSSGTSHGGGGRSF